MSNTVWMKPPFGVGEPREFEATPEVLTPLMVAGWNQCVPPSGPPLEVSNSLKKEEEVDD